MPTFASPLRKVLTISSAWFFTMVFFMSLYGSIEVLKLHMNGTNCSLCGNEHFEKSCDGTAISNNYPLDHSFEKFSEDFSLSARF